MAELVTGEAVALDLRVARLASRGCAILVDLLLQMFLLYVLLYIAFMTSLVADDAWSTGLTILAVAAVFVGYPCLFETLTRGRTLGKMALGLRVVADDGGPVRFRQALLRALAGVIELWMFNGSPALITSFCNRRGKRLGDLFAGTIVIQERVPVAVLYGPVAVMPPQLAGWARTLELSMLSDELAMTARQYLARFWELLPEVRDSLGQRIAGQVVAVVSPPPPPGVRPEILLSAVLAERRHREERRLAERWARRMRRFGPPAWGAAPAPVPAMAGAPWGGTPPHPPTRYAMAGAPWGGTPPHPPTRYAISGAVPSTPPRQGPPPPPPFSTPRPGQPQFLPPSDYGAGPYQNVLNGPQRPGPYPPGPQGGPPPQGPYPGH